METEMERFALYLAIFCCFGLLFLFICWWIFSPAEARVLLFALCELMSAAVAFFWMLFCEMLLRRGLCEFLFLKKWSFLWFFDEKSTFAADFGEKNNGFSLYMVKYGNNYICSGYLCLFFTDFEYLVCKKYESRFFLWFCAWKMRLLRLKFVDILLRNSQNIRRKTHWQLRLFLLFLRVGFFLCAPLYEGEQKNNFLLFLQNPYKKNVCKVEAMGD